MAMAWGILLAASVFEIALAIGLKYTEGFTRLVPSLITLLLMALSMGLLALALRQLPLGANAVWTGIGTVGTALVGIQAIGEAATPLRLGCIALIVTGIVGLKLVGDT